MLYILLPAYNEAESLPSLLPKLKATLGSMKTDYMVIVGNDGSSDRTAAIAKNFAEDMPLHVLENRYNRGLGETSRNLFEFAAERGEPGDVIIRCDCDDTHEPETIPRLVAKLHEGYDVVIASRFEPGGGQLGVSRYRALISRCANIFMSVVFSVEGVREYSCGFRAYRVEAIQHAMEVYGNNFIQLKGLGFTGTLEKLVKLKMLSARFAEVPFVLRYDQKISESKMVSSVTTLGYLTMAVLYHWPWGGWRRAYRDIDKLPVVSGATVAQELSSPAMTSVR